MTNPAKEALKRLVFGPHRISQWRAVGVDPERLYALYRLRLESGSSAADVTESSSVAALRPVTFAVRASGPAPSLPTGRAHLRVHPAAEDARAGAPRALAEIGLSYLRDVETDAAKISLYGVAGHRNRSLAPGDYLRFRLRQRWEIFRDKTPYNFRLATSELFALYVFYYVPRPVHLVSVEFEGASNIFPMDLVGRMGKDLFLLALRSTSPAIPLMKGSKRLALAAAPFEAKEIAYKLGEHHKKTTIDWSALPFSPVPSPVFGLKVPDSVLAVREVEVLATELVDTHVLFVTRIVGEETWRAGRQLCHIPGLLHEYLTRVAPDSAAAKEMEGL